MTPTVSTSRQSVRADIRARALAAVNRHNAERKWNLSRKERRNLSRAYAAGAWNEMQEQGASE
jgi:serine/threonine-protein kinase RIO1